MKHDIQQTQVGQLKIAWQGFGDPTKPPLLLLMGLGMQMVAWPEPLCEALAREGYYVLRMDNRDIGQSTWLDHFPTPDLRAEIKTRLAGLPVQSAYSLRDMADDVAGLLKALKLPPVHLVGCSMGGMIAQLVALHHGDRVRSLTSIMSTTGDPSLPPPKKHMAAMMLAPLPRDREGYMDNAVFTWSLLDGRRFRGPRQHVRHLSGLAYDRGIHPAGFARQLHAILAAPSRAEDLKTLHTPTLVLHGEDDPLVPVACGRHTAECVPDARLEVLPGMGHSMPPDTWPILADWIVEHCERHDP